ncbi:MAG: ABC transporter permease [Planctomycetes bacterium]|nr:ABC transporter permease [Planctomycetota bacterium]
MSEGQEQGWLSSFLRRYRNEVGLVIAIFAVVSFTTAMDPAYREKPWSNATELLRQVSMVGIFALGAALVIIAGGIDLSSGSVIAFSGAICASLMLALAPVDDQGHAIVSSLSTRILLLAILGTLAVGFLIGTFHAWLITVVGLPPFVATLASLVGLRSLARVLVPAVSKLYTGNDTKQLYVYDDAFRQLGSTWWIPLVIFVILAIAMWVLLSKTVVGRHLYAMGGNEQAARLSGIRTDRLKWLAYAIAAMTASLAGILYCAYVATADPEKVGRGYELTAIAAAVVGGCSLQGGIGTVQGVLLGVLFLRVVIDAVAKLIKGGTADDFEGMIVGLLVVLAVAFNELRQGRGGRKQEFFPGVLGLMTMVILTGGAGMMATLTISLRAGWIAAIVAAVVLVAIRLLESRRRTSDRKSAA